MGEAQRRYSAAIWAVASKTDFCVRCGGDGVGWLNGKPSPCPSCGNLDADKREDEMIFDRHRNSPPVALSNSDLTQEERGLMKLWRAKYGKRYGDDILLSWIEGRRYDPRTDPDLQPTVNRLHDLRMGMEEEAERDNPQPVRRASRLPNVEIERIDE